MRNNLTTSNVLLDTEQHKYYLNGEEIQGITKIIKEMLYPDLYTDVPDHILEKAAEKGNSIHELIEFCDTEGIASQVPEVAAYQARCRELNLKPIANEFIVSDNDRIASPVDVIFEGNIIADIKTTAKLFEGCVRWQLSIYAWLFEMQTGQKAGKLMVLWLRDNVAQFKEVERIPSHECDKMIEAYFEGKKYVNKYSDSLKEVSSDMAEILNMIEVNEISIKEAEAENKLLKSKLIQLMVKDELKAIKTDTMNVSYIAPSERKKVDWRSFQAAENELYTEIASKYSKPNPIKGSIRIKLK